MYDVILNDVPLEDCIEATVGARTSSWPRPASTWPAPRSSWCRRSAGSSSSGAPSSEVRDDYDYVLIDCPPSLGLLTVNALAAATEVLVPIQCEYYALEGLGQLLRNVDLVQKNLNPELEVSAIVLVMYDARTKLADQVAAEVREPLRRQGLPQRHAPHGPAVGGAVVRAADHRVRPELPRAPSPTGSWPRRSAVARRSGLGKGLGALIPTGECRSTRRRRDAAGAPDQPGHGRTSTSPGATSTRRRWSSLTASVRELGVLQPILVRPAATASSS